MSICEDILCQARVSAVLLLISVKGWLKWVKKVTWSHSADSGHWQCVNSSNFSSEFLM